MRRSLLPIIILVGGILILAAAGVAFLLQNNNPAPAPSEGVALLPGAEEGAGQPVPVSTLGPTIDVVVSLQTVPRGWRMTEQELTIDTRLRTEVGPNVITDTAKVIGLYARHDIFQGETLTEETFVSDPTLIGQETFGPSSTVPQGWVAAAVPMDRLSSVAYGLDEGDTVDIMISFLFNELDQQLQTLLNNSAVFILEVPDPESGELVRNVVVVDPFGRFEQLPTGDLAHIAPSEPPRPFHVSMLLQNARVIQVGPWTPAEPLALPTPLPEPGGPTPTPGGPPPTPTPTPPDVLLLALPPQQQLLLKYAVESHANIDFALRAPGDGQIYNVQNVDLNYILSQFNIEVPPNFNYTIDPGFATPPADSSQEEGQVGEGES